MDQYQLPTELVVHTDRRFLGRDLPSPELLKVLDVDPMWVNYLRVLDRQGSLALVHYINTWVSADEHVIDEKPLAEIGHVRGTIVDTETCKIVCRSYPYTPEAVSNDPERIATLLPNYLTTVSLYRACEGTVLRLFWYNEEWCISTHRKIDAYNSYWSGPTFGSLFEETREFEFNDLDKELCYIFLLSHDDNRLVYKVHESQLMLISIYNRPEVRFLDFTEYGVGFSEPLSPTGCVHPRPLGDVDSIADLQEIVDKQSGFDDAGVIAISNPSDPHPVKIVNTEYDSIRNARGNDPSVRSRYIQLRGTPAGGLLINWFTDPNYQESFDHAEDEIDNLVERLHTMYVNRYIRKDFSQLPKEEFVTLQRCHEWHTADRCNNIVTAAKVRDYLNSTPTHYLLVMLNRQRREQREAAREAAALETIKEKDE